MSNAAESAHAEWDYREVEGSFGQTFDTAIPCQLRFTETPSQDTDRFHAALEANGYERLDTDPARKHTDERAYYDGEVVSADHYTRVSIFLSRRRVRLYPHDDYVPTVAELARLIAALEVGFAAPLEHNPIDGGDR